MTFPFLLAFLSVAFPGEGARLGHVKRVYVIGAVDKGVTNILVNGTSFPVYRTGSWAAMASVAEGDNEITVSSGSETLVRRFRILPKRAPAEKASKREYKKHPYASDEPQGVPTAKKPSEITVFLDPGHGGPDSGALSPRSFPEKQVNLLVAREVRSELTRMGYNVLMTRDDDIFIPLQERPRKAHEIKADAFVSIHHNAPAHDGDAASVRYLSVFAWNDIGKALASSIEKSLAAALAGELPSKGVMHANFTVTRSTQVPSCLLEVDFVTSPQGEAACWNVEHRRKVGKAVAAGIDKWCRGM